MYHHLLYDQIIMDRYDKNAKKACLRAFFCLGLRNVDTKQGVCSREELRDLSTPRFGGEMATAGSRGISWSYTFSR